MIDADKLHSQLTIDNIKQIVKTLGGEVYRENNEHIIYNSICHGSNSHKLWFYKSSKTFYCFSRCSCGFNIFKLVQKRMKLLGKDDSFPYALQYCCDVCGISYEQTKRLTPKRVEDNWKKDLDKYLRNKSTYGKLEIYDKSILNFFPKMYHETWLNEGISEEVMEMYGVRWYPYRSQIVLPVFDEDGELVGIRVRNMNPSLVEQGMKYIPLIMANGTCYKFSTNMILYGLNYNKQAIIKHKKIILCEGEKSVQKLATWYGMDNIAVATLGGSKIGKYRRNKILEMGVEEVIILADKDWKDEGDKEYVKWYDKIMGQSGEFKGYCKVSICYDNLDLLGYKENATDGGKEVFERLFKEREEVVYDT